MYSISDHGIVVSRHYDKGKTMTQHVTKKGYMRVAIYNDQGTQKHCFVHKLVATVYIPNPNNLPQINHEDGNKKNNFMDNLKWCTGSQNLHHAYDMGLKVPYRGEKHPSAKLTWDQVNEIRRMYKTGTSSFKKLSIQFNVCRPNIESIIKNKSWIIG